MSDPNCVMDFCRGEGGGEEARTPLALGKTERPNISAEIAYLDFCNMFAPFGLYILDIKMMKKKKWAAAPKLYNVPKRHSRRAEHSVVEEDPRHAETRPSRG